MDFLYENFDQLIFFDLCIHCNPMQHSSDGSWEFLQQYPDPEEKITLIDKLDISDVVADNGASLVEKQKMFRVGSGYVDDDIDVFWCTDMDEFFNRSLIDKAETIFSEREDVISIRVNLMTSWREKDIVLDRPNGWLAQRGRDILTGLQCPPRIVRHSPGTVYPHCQIQKLGKVFEIGGNDEMLFHFAWVGDARVLSKRIHQPVSVEEFDRWYDEVWRGFDTSEVRLNYEGYIPGLKLVLPNPQIGHIGLRRFSPEFPEYMDIDGLWGELNAE